MLETFFTFVWAAYLLGMSLVFWVLGIGSSAYLISRYFGLGKKERLLNLAAKQKAMA